MITFDTFENSFIVQFLQSKYACGIRYSSRKYLNTKRDGYLVQYLEVTNFNCQTLRKLQKCNFTTILIIIELVYFIFLTKLD